MKSKSNYEAIRAVKKSGDSTVYLAPSHWPFHFGYDMAKDEIKYEGSSKEFKAAVIEYLKLCDSYGAVFETRAYDHDRDREVSKNMKTSHIKVNGENYEIVIWAGQDEEICNYGMLKYVSEHQDKIDDVLEERDNNLMSLIRGEYI